MTGKIDLRMDEESYVTLLTLVYPIIEKGNSILRASATLHERKLLRMPFILAFQYLSVPSGSISCIFFK